jgi:hypothetical protein
MEAAQMKLRYTHDHALNGVTALLEDVPLAIVPVPFLRQWRQWLHRPDLSRPVSLDNSAFVCKHGLLAIDPNDPYEMDPNQVTVIKKSEWDIFSA